MCPICCIIMMVSLSYNVVLHFEPFLIRCCFLVSFYISLYFFFSLGLLETLFCKMRL